MSREREKRKAVLLRQVQQQRLDLSVCKKNFIASTAHYDRGWLTVVHLRRYLAIGSGLVGLWLIRNPRRATRWTKRGVGLWSTWRLVRRWLPERR